MATPTIFWIFAAALTNIAVWMLVLLDSIDESVVTGVLVAAPVMSRVMYDIDYFWACTLLISAIADFTFARKHWEDILIYSRLSLPLGVFALVVLAVSTRSDSNDLTAWAPLALGSYMLITALSLPFLFPSLRSRRAAVLPRFQAEIPQYLYRDMDLDYELAPVQMAENGPLPGRFLAAEEVRGTQGFESTEDVVPQDIRDLEVSGMRRSPSGFSVNLSDHSSDIDLEEGGQILLVALQRMASAPQARYLIASIPESFSEMGSHADGLAVSSMEDHSHQDSLEPTQPGGASSSSGSKAVNLSSAASAGTQNLLQY